VNPARAIRKSRIAPLAVVLAVAGSGLCATIGQPGAADAAEFHTAVACKESSSPVPSHNCLANELPAAYFESSVSTNYVVCLEDPSQEVSCAEDFAGAYGLYANPITADDVGSYAVSWWIGEYEVGYWRFRMEPGSGSSSPSPSSGSLTPGKGSAAAPSGLELELSPSSVETGAAPSGASAPTAAAAACRAADTQVTKLKAELKHASKKQASALASKLKAAKAKAKKAC
jgi:hypothetical protein